MIYLIGLIPVIIVITIATISNLAEKENRERQIKKDSWMIHIEHIRKTYPNAFSKYWCKPDLANSVFKNYSNVILNKNSVNWSEKQWRILEEDLGRKKEEKWQNEIQKKVWLINQIEEIKKQYPNGLKEYKKRNIASSDDDIVSNVEKMVKDRGLIMLLEKEYNNAQKTNANTEK